MSMWGVLDVAELRAMTTERDLWRRNAIDNTQTINRLAAELAAMSGEVKLLRAQIRNDLAEQRIVAAAERSSNERKIAELRDELRKAQAPVRTEAVASQRWIGGPTKQDTGLFLP